MCYKFANWFYVLALLVISLYREESGDRGDPGQTGCGGLVSLCKAGAMGDALQSLCCWQAREAEFEAEQERIRREKEKEIARMRVMQEKAQDYLAEKVPVLYLLPPLPFLHCSCGSRSDGLEGGDVEEMI